jgi:hypothetical protein
MKTWLFNPFKFIAGSKALWLGTGILLITATLCLFTQEHLDGVIDVHVGRVVPSYVYFIEPFIDWLCLLLPLYIFGRSISTSSIRFIDIAGTSALSRYPVFFMALLAILTPRDMGPPDKLLTLLHNNPAIAIKLGMIGLLVLPFMVWTIALAYNAYSVSANLKGAKAIWSFIASMVIAEILSKIIISLF